MVVTIKTPGQFSQPGDSRRDLFWDGEKRDPFKGLSDLQLGDEKGTLNHLEMVV